jgi:hypothetical protein
MSWKSLVLCVGLICVLAVPARAVPSLRVTPSQLVNASGNRVWTVQVIPDAGMLPSSLAVELPFSHVPGSTLLPVSIMNPGAQAAGNNITYYFNETAAGSDTLLWNTQGSAGDTEQNLGANPFTMGDTEGLYVNGADLFAALGSTVFPDPTASVNTLQIVTQGGGGVLRLGDAVVAQDGANTLIGTDDFYVTGDFDGNGIVGPPDLSLLLFAFGQHYTTQVNWDGFLPVAPSGIVGPPDLSNLLFNFGAGLGFGSGSGVGAVAVPEPTSILLALTGALAVFSWLGIRRR